MDIKPPQPVSGVIPADSSEKIPVQSQPRLPADWQVGKILEAIVTRIRGQQLFLTAGGQTLQARIPDSLQAQPGDILTIRLTSHAGVADFKILQHRPVARQAQLLETAQQQLLIKQSAITQQPTTTQSSKQPYEVVEEVARLPLLSNREIPAPVIREVRQWLDTLPLTRQLTDPIKLKQSIQHAGIFTEYNLLNHQQADVSLASDHRVQLLRLASLIRASLPVSTPSPGIATPEQTAHGTVPQPKRITVNPPPSQAETLLPGTQQKPRIQSTAATTQTVAETESPLPSMPLLQKLSDAIESLVVRQQGQQLQLLQGDGATRPVLVVDLPVRDQQHIDLIQLRIEKDDSSTQRNDSEAIAHWKVTVHFDFENHGEITAHLFMHGSTLSTRFEIPSADTRELYNHQLNRLASSLQQNGFKDVQLLVTQAIYRSSSPADIYLQEP